MIRLRKSVRGQHDAGASVKPTSDVGLWSFCPGSKAAPKPSAKSASLPAPAATKESDAAHFGRSSEFGKLPWQHVVGGQSQGDFWQSYNAVMKGLFP